MKLDVAKGSNTMLTNFNAARLSELDTPDKRRRYVATFYSSRFWGTPGGFTRDPDIMDTWATSSLSPQVASGWDTDPELFARVRRDFSHGCIRVEDPKALAEWVLRNNPGWTRERIEAAFKAEQQQQVNLAHEIPVLIVYGTAIVKENGDVFFFKDIYGYDKAMGKLFEQAFASKN